MAKVIVFCILIFKFLLADTTVYNEWGKSSGTVGFIIGGDVVAKPDLYPWHVAIFISEVYQGGGSLISERHVLTATHVTVDPVFLKRLSPEHFSVKAGIVKLDVSKAKEYHVEKIIRYPGYNEETLLHDMCLLRLKTFVEFGPTVRPVFLWDNPHTDISSLVDKKLKGIVVGWGLTETGRTNQLRSASLDFVKQAECLKNVPNYGKTLVKDQSFCANDKSQTVCRGDSGSGLFLFNEKKQAYVLRGLVSQGVPSGHSCKQAKEALFTDVVYYLKWIEKEALPGMYNLLGFSACTTKDAGVVSLRYSFRKKLMIGDCHGVLVSKNHVLTLASCVENTRYRKLDSVSMKNKTNDRVRNKHYTFKSIQTHQELAIISLHNQVTDIEPVCLPSRPERSDSAQLVFWKKGMRFPNAPLQLQIDGVMNQNWAQKKIIDSKSANDSFHRIGASPLFYSFRDESGEHVFLGGIEHCPELGCSTNNELRFINLLHYRSWIKSTVNIDIDGDPMIPPMD
ncbi:ovochymase-2-like isoform X1 [Uranotaenia lowii]|uniref:ovochymase-2-like isoform X1 n=1 Tax=Uranotaenia lowii TaxID=190385 RepID=UPI00247A0BEA|nr:ovochymase-2-like isoform X1 [Uranotaenia lowii]